jgi:hypothetical protein
MHWKRLGCEQPSICSGLAHWTVRWCTGQRLVRQAGQRWSSRSRESMELYGYNSPDCPVEHRTVRWVIRDELAALGKRKRRRGYNSPDCPVVHRTVRWANGRQRQRSAAQSAGDTWTAPTVSWCTGLSGVHRKVSSAPTGPEEQRSDAPDMEGDRVPDMNSGCPVVHRTILCTTRQKARMAFQIDLQWLLAALGL